MMPRIGHQHRRTVFLTGTFSEPESPFFHGNAHDCRNKGYDAGLPDIRTFDDKNDFPYALKTNHTAHKQQEQTYD